MEKSVPTNWKLCVTCANYCGNVRPNAFSTFVYFDGNERGYCASLRINKDPMCGSCYNYSPRFNR